VPDSRRRPCSCDQRRRRSCIGGASSSGAPGFCCSKFPPRTNSKAARFARETRRIVHGAFQEPGRWLSIDVAREELRWPDGAHLDERSAVLVARAIDKASASQGR